MDWTASSIAGSAYEDDRGRMPVVTLMVPAVGLRYSMAANVSLRYDHGWQLRDGPPGTPGNGRSHFSLLVGF